MNSTARLLVAMALAGSVGCKKPASDKSPAAASSSDLASWATGSGSAAVGSGADRSRSGSASAASATIGSDAATSSADDDHIVVLAKHIPPKQSDPVRVRVERFRVVHASFDPKKIEGGTATIELDLSSLRSGNGERDKDLESPVYLDVGKFATVTIEVANVKKTADKSFTADASVKLRGVTKTYPVTFDVIEQEADRIRVKGEHTFSRLDFSIGTDPATDSQQQVDPELTIEMVVTLEKT